jgi:3-phosphoshikimate 1-carboxyvinyltransferase
VPGLEVDDVATTAKTLPDFPAMWLRMLDGGG